MGTMKVIMSAVCARGGAPFRLCGKAPPAGTLYAYLAYGGATLSAKDALAQGMLAIAQEKGFLKPGQPVVECSSGTFAVALAIACSHSGHPLVLCVPGSIGPARQKLLTELGAKLAFTTAAHGRRCPRTGCGYAHWRVFPELFRQ